MAAALPRAEARFLKKLLFLVVVAIAAGVGGGWLLFDRLEDEPEARVAPVT